MGERRSLTGRKAARLDVQRLLLRGAWKKGALIDFLLAEEGQARALAKSRAKSPGPLLCHSSPPASLPLRDAQFFPLLWGRRADCLHPTSTQLRGAWGRVHFVSCPSVGIAKPLSLCPEVTVVGLDRREGRRAATIHL